MSWIGQKYYGVSFEEFMKLTEDERLALEKKYLENNKLYWDWLKGNLFDEPNKSISTTSSGGDFKIKE